MQMPTVGATAGEALALFCVGFSVGRRRMADGAWVTPADIEQEFAALEERDWAAFVVVCTATMHAWEVAGWVTVLR